MKSGRTRTRQGGGAACADGALLSSRVWLVLISILGPTVATTRARPHPTTCRGHPGVGARDCHRLCRRGEAGGGGRPPPDGGAGSRSAGRGVPSRPGREPSRRIPNFLVKLLDFLGTSWIHSLRFVAGSTG